MQRTDNPSSQQDRDTDNPSSQREERADRGPRPDHSANRGLDPDRSGPGSNQAEDDGLQRRRSPRFPHRFFATCARGTEGPLRKELVELGMHAPTGERGGVWFQGTAEHGMRVCLHSRVAMRVLLQIAEFDAAGPDALYQAARGCDWQAFIDLERTFAVRATVRDSAITHSGYAALKVKDAIADSLRAQLGARPDVDPRDPDITVVLHLRNDHGRLFLDLAGEPLHRRGYRVAMTEAPLKETLAAAVLRLGRVPSELPMVDPMAGSGTLAIEHALIARRMAPGQNRHFAFERWPSFDATQQQRWAELKEEARARVLPRAPAPIICADSLPTALDAARANAAHAGVTHDLEFRVADVRSPFDARWPRGVVCTNPPYGERLSGGSDDDPDDDAGGSWPVSGELAELYRALASMLRGLAGWRVALLCRSPELPEALRMRPEISHRLFNGDLEVRLLCYEVAAGAQRPRDKGPPRPFPKRR